jgi:hypothetical protein|tara:strand:- start:151 stop:699 length:549 start_codon:yes stop_codon:yes gene_type:complete
MVDLITYDDSGRPRLSVVIENLTPTLAVFVAGNATFPSSDYATRDMRNFYSVLDFDDSTNESISFVGLMPQQYAGNGIELRLFFTMETATSGDVDWSVKFEKLTSFDQDIDSVSYSNATSVIDTAVPSTSGEIAITSISVTDGANMDNITKGDMFVMNITRSATTDTASGDAELLGVEMRGL